MKRTWLWLLAFSFVSTSHAGEEKPATPPLQFGDAQKNADLKYYEGPGADPEKNLLDFYQAKGAQAGKPAPVLVWIHGGAWTMGSKEQCAGFCNSLASSGVAVAAISYRLSPAVKHPAHAEDCARAVAWVRLHAGEYNADPKRLYLGGISAGGHLAALLALDPKYLAAVGVQAKRDLAGVVAVSGVYRLQAKFEGGPLFFTKAFGNDEKTHEDASPLAHVTKNAPPFFILHAERDIQWMRDQATELQKALEQAGGHPSEEEVPDAGHLTIVRRLTDEECVQGQHVRRFILDGPPKEPAPAKP